jgi:hypothetical protein
MTHSFHFSRFSFHDSPLTIDYFSLVRCLSVVFCLSAVLWRMTDLYWRISLFPFLFSRFTIDYFTLVRHLSGNFYDGTVRQFL